MFLQSFVYDKLYHLLVLVREDSVQFLLDIFFCCMKMENNLLVKLCIFIIVVVFSTYTLSYHTTNYDLQGFYRMISINKLFDRTNQFVSSMISSNTTESMIVINNNTITTKSSLITTATHGLATAIDPADRISERPTVNNQVDVKTSNGSIVVFIFHTSHHSLAGLQMQMIKRMAINLVDIELFLDSPMSPHMKNVSALFNAKVFSYPEKLHTKDAGASDRNTEIVNWALTTRAKNHLSNGTAVLLLDGDVFPLSPFDSVSLLNSRRLVCRKHPAVASRYCWIGLICLSPEMASTIHDLDVSQTRRFGKGYDSGGKTIEYLLKYPNASFAYMRETILLKQDKTLFWGAMNEDIGWIRGNFEPCDKCGPEIFFSPFSDSNAVFYHMISATSDWRFSYQNDRAQAVWKNLLKSPYGSNQTISTSELSDSIKRVKMMQLIPPYGNLTCESICKH